MLLNAISFQQKTLLQFVYFSQNSQKGKLEKKNKLIIKERKRSVISGVAREEEKEKRARQNNSTAFTFLLSLTPTIIFPLIITTRVRANRNFSSSPLAHYQRLRLARLRLDQMLLFSNLVATPSSSVSYYRDFVSSLDCLILLITKFSSIRANLRLPSNSKFHDFLRFDVIFCESCKL